MATFIHLTDARQAKRILRDGIRPTPIAAPYAFHIGLGFRKAKAVFCVPVVPNFQTTFQWLRELRRNGFRTGCGIQFKIADAEMVQVGRFAKPSMQMTASEAVALFQNLEDARGLEVHVLRAIASKEIVRIRFAPQITGWRYYPEAKGRKPLWPHRGEINASRIRQSIDARWDNIVRLQAKYEAEGMTANEAWSRAYADGVAAPILTSRQANKAARNRRRAKT